MTFAAARTWRILSMALPSSSITSPALRACASATTSIGSGELRVGDQDAAVRAHRQALADGVLGALGTHGDEDDLAAVRLLELQPFLDAALVAGVEDRLLLARDRVVALEREVRVRIGYLLDGDDDLQGVG